MQCKQPYCIAEYNHWL